MGHWPRALHAGAQESPFRNRLRRLSLPTRQRPALPRPMLHALFAMAFLVSFSSGSPALAQANAGSIFTECSHCPEMVVVPAGSFTMGSPGHELGRDPGEGPQHRVVITRPFAVAKFEVTVEQYAACMKAGACSGNVDDQLGARYPISGVTFDDARRYVAWLSRQTGKSYRLLSEAEYEYAARGGSETVYPWGNDLGYAGAWCRTCGLTTEGGEKPSEVGAFPPNGFGLYDMVGNFQSWVEDCRHEDYRGAPTNGSVWTGGSCFYRMTRGGDWSRRGASRSAERMFHNPEIRDVAIGLRVGRSVEGGNP